MDKNGFITSQNQVKGRCLIKSKRKGSKKG